MDYRTYQPGIDLAPHVECYWTLKAGRAGHQPFERVLPDGCFELIFNLADRFQEKTRESHAPITQPASFVVGQITRAMLVRPTGRIDLVAIRFHPASAPRFIDASASDFTDRVIALGEVDPMWHRCWEQLGSTLDREDRIAVLESYLRIARTACADATPVEDAVHKIKQSHGIVSIDALVRASGVSSRTLLRGFHQYVGVGPKTLARTVRVQSALEIKRHHPTLPLTAGAYRCGYFDQAHFTRDFNSVAGLPPSLFFGEQHEFSDRLSDKDPEAV